MKKVKKVIPVKVIPPKVEEQKNIQALDEKTIEQLCIAEIQTILMKYNCRLEASMHITETKVTPTINVIVNTKLG